MHSDPDSSRVQLSNRSKLNAPTADSLSWPLHVTSPDPQDERNVGEASKFRGFGVIKRKVLHNGYPRDLTTCAPPTVKC
jgi:hypothetical protein